MKKALWLVLVGLSLDSCAAGGAARKPALAEKGQAHRTVAPPQYDEAWLRGFIERHLRRLEPLYRANNLAYWLAATTGKEDAYAMNGELEMAIRDLYSDPESYAALKKAKAGGAVKDAMLARQLELLLLEFEENQVPPELNRRMVELSTQIQQAFNTWRGQLDGKAVSDSELIAVLKGSIDSARRRAAWEAYQSRGALVRDRLLELVRLRNQAARSLGYPDYYQMQLRLMEQDPAEIKRIFDELALATDQPFDELMQKVRAELARRYGVGPKDIMPWHFEDPFFQEAPRLSGVDLDRFFRGIDQKKLAAEFFRGLGLEVDDILARSDLFEREGKMPHAFCTDIDRRGDVRVLANLSPSESQTSTLLHELGHGVYSKYLDSQLPWLLREESHPFATEAVAMFFGRQTRSPEWLKAVLGAPAAEIDRLAPEIAFQQRLGLLIMARWTMVMVNFERGLYENPEQDLNALWWELKKRYQLLDAPERPAVAADWAAKIHISAWPVYYHNYMLGEMMASQLHFYLAREILKTDPSRLQVAGQRAAGEWLRQNIFAPGRSLHWDELLRRATGETLNPRYFTEQFVGKN